MPQINKSVKKDLSFSVSPWQSKRATPEITEDQPYQEIQLPLKRKTSEHLAEPKAEASQRPRPSQRKGSASQWQRKKKDQTPNENTEQPATDTPNGPDSAHHIDSKSDTDTDAGIIGTAQGSSLQGTAVLALLPDGQISGHILDTHSTACFGFMARQLTAERECTRDIEWRLLHATIIDYKSSKETSFAAERTAEDAATIQAPLQMHGGEEQLIAALQGRADADTDINFKFQCTTILVSRFWQQKLMWMHRAETKWLCKCYMQVFTHLNRLRLIECCRLQANDLADSFLLTFNPKLQGKDAVVNKGNVNIHFVQRFGRQPHIVSNDSLMPSAHAYDSDFDN